MTRLIRWWMSKPTEFKYAFAGIITPYVLMGLLFWLVKH
jgi:hypothetical protein